MRKPQILIRLAGARYGKKFFEFFESFAKKRGFVSRIKLWRRHPHKPLFFFTCCGHCLLGVRRSLIDSVQLQINGLKNSLENLSRSWLKVAERLKYHNRGHWCWELFFGWQVCGS
jgi:hypothetical protein